jgi:hypothetical protein
VKYPKECPIVADHIDDRRRGSDRRQAPRRRIFKAAHVYWENGAWTECIVRNLSDTGAQLEICGPAPRAFNLMIADQLVCECRVVWRQGNRVGVRFQRQIQTIQPLPVSILSACKQHADKCRALADRAQASDRETLLNVAVAWETVGLRYRGKSRALSRG